MSECLIRIFVFVCIIVDIIPALCEGWKPLPFYSYYIFVHYYSKMDFHKKLHGRTVLRGIPCEFPWNCEFTWNMSCTCYGLPQRNRVEYRGFPLVSLGVHRSPMEIHRRMNSINSIISSNNVNVLIQIPPCRWTTSPRALSTSRLDYD